MVAGGLRVDDDGARFGVGGLERLELGVERRRGRGAYDEGCALSAVLRELLTDRGEGFEGSGGADLVVALTSGAEAVGVIEAEDLGLRGRGGAAPGVEGAWVAFDLGGSSVVASYERGDDFVTEVEVGGVVARFAGKEVFRASGEGDDVLYALAHATRREPRTGDSGGCAEKAEELATIYIVERQLIGSLGELVLSGRLFLGRGQ